MTVSVSHHQPGVRLGVDTCPGVDERGHGLTMSIIHDSGCCREWETGQASTPARTRALGRAAARWGSTWPGQPQRPEPSASAQAQAEARAQP